MVEIGKRIFAHLDREKERNLMRSELSSQDIEKSLTRIAFIYSDYVFSYFKRKIFFLPYTLKAEARKKKLAQLQKLLDTAMDFGVSPEIYIKAQFEEQSGWFRKKGIHTVPFGSLIGPKAIERFKEYENRVGANYSSKEARRKEFYSVQALDVERSVTDSMERFYERLVALQEFVMGNADMPTAIEELEVMSRAHQVSNVYVFISPLSGKGGSEYLDGIFADMVEKLTAPQREVARQTHRELLKSIKFSDEEIRKHI